MSRNVTPSELEQELRREFAARRKSNASYSLRAMARDLGVPASTLHKIFNGERKLGLRLAKEVASRLGLVVLPDKSGKTRRTGKSVRHLDPNSRTHVSWINLAILEMLKLEDFHPTAKWIASRLGIGAGAVDHHLREMEEAGMLSRDGDKWIDLLEQSAVANIRPITTETVRSMIKELLHVAQVKVDSVAYEEREHSFNIFPVAKSDLPKLRKKIVGMRRSLINFAEASRDPKEEVYTLQIACFPLTGSFERV